MDFPSIQIELFDDIGPETFKSIKCLTDDLPDGANVELQIASYGGQILYAVSIIETLKRFHTHANIIGFACSAAAIIAISCEECSMSENASMLLHSAWSESADPDDPGIKRCNDLQLSIIKKRCPDFDPKNINKENWLSAEDCLKLHLIDNIYITDSIDYLATCKRYAAKLSNLTNIYNKEITMQDDKVNEIIEEVKEESREPEKVEEKVDVEVEPENHDLVEVVEKLTEELNALKARVLALETPAEDAKEDAPVAEVGCDDKQERINNIYKNIMQPLARVSIGAPKATAQTVVNKVDYKAFASFLND